MFELYGVGEIISYALCYLVIIPLGLVIGWKLYSNIKNEEHKEKGKVIQRILKTYCVVQCVAWPLFSSIFGFVFFIKRTAFSFDHSVFMTIMVSSLRALVKLNLLFVGFNSFIIAVCRYVFIMQFFDYISIAKLRKIVVASSILVPISLGILTEAFTCYPLATPIASNPMVQLNQMIPDETIIDPNVSLRNHTFLIPESPLFLVVDKYLPNTIKYGSKLVLHVILFVMYSNIPESFFYTHIFITNER